MSRDITAAARRKEHRTPGQSARGRCEGVLPDERAELPASYSCRTCGVRHGRPTRHAATARRWSKNHRHPWHGIIELVTHDHCGRGGQDRIHDRRLTITGELHDLSRRAGEPGRGECDGREPRERCRQRVRSRDRAERPPAHGCDAVTPRELRRTGDPPAALAHSERDRGAWDGIPELILRPHGGCRRQERVHRGEQSITRDDQELGGRPRQRRDAKRRGATGEAADRRLEALRPDHAPQRGRCACAARCVGHSDRVGYGSDPRRRAEPHGHAADGEVVRRSDFDFKGQRQQEASDSALPRAANHHQPRGQRLERGHHRIEHAAGNTAWTRCVGNDVQRRPQRRSPQHATAADARNVGVARRPGDVELGHWHAGLKREHLEAQRVTEKDERDAR